MSHLGEEKKRAMYGGRQLGVVPARAGKATKRRLRAPWVDTARGLFQNRSCGSLPGRVGLRGRGRPEAHTWGLGATSLSDLGLEQEARCPLPSCCEVGRARCAWMRADTSVCRAAGIGDAQAGTSSCRGQEVREKLARVGAWVDQSGRCIGRSSAAITLSLISSSSDVLRSRG